MKRSDRRQYVFTESNPTTIQTRWPLCHLYQMMVAAFLFLMILLCSTGQIPGAEQRLEKMNDLLEEQLPVQEWLQQWRETWEEWMYGSNNSR